MPDLVGPAAAGRRGPVMEAEDGRDGVEQRWVDVDGLRVHCRARPGEGPALVLLPGGMIDSSLLSWRAILSALPARYDVYVPDLPGYGETEKPAGLSYSTAYYVRFAERFMDAMGLRRAGVFGSSMSGAVALGLALRRPERVERLVLSGAYGLQRRVPLHELTYLAARVPGIDDAVRRLLRLHPVVVRLALPVAVRDWSRIDDVLVRDAWAGLQSDRALLAFVRWLRTELYPHRVRSNYTPYLERLRLPVLLLHGAHDWMMPVGAARRAAARLPDAELHVFPEARHLVPRERPEAAAAAIRAFLRRTDRAENPLKDKRL